MELGGATRSLGMYVKPEELKNLAVVLRELGLSYEETLNIMRGIATDSPCIKRLWKDSEKAKLVKLGLTLIAFPEPTPVSETLGVFVLSLGMIQTKMERSALHIEDIYGTFQGVIGSLQTIKRELVSTS